MSIGEGVGGVVGGIARRLESVADEVADMKAVLGRHELALERAGRGAREVAGALEAAWAAQLDLASRLVAGLTGLAASVRLAGTNYDATDNELRVGAHDKGEAG